MRMELKFVKYIDGMKVYKRGKEEKETIPKKEKEKVTKLSAFDGGDIDVDVGYKRKEK